MTIGLPRRVEPELLDRLDAEDPRAKRSRGDLRRIHRAMATSTELQRLLAWIAARSRVFFCCEPRRAALPLAASHLVGLIGAGPVTRQDAVLSVHAGFRAQELSGLWPNPREFKLHEYPAGLFSHCFLAVRK